MLMPRETSQTGFDAVLPPEMAVRAESVGERKVQQDVMTTFVLAVLAGAFIAWGGAFSTTVTTGAAGHLSFGVAKLLGGLVFCLGLILVVVAGAELFTGNNLIVMAWASRRITTAQVFRNWLIVYVGNFLGAVLTAVLIFYSGYATAANGAVGENVLGIAVAKCSLSVTAAIAAGVGCNALVCLAVWLCLSARSIADKVLAILFPITAFVTTGMEHCVANMYFIPLGLLVKSTSTDSAAYSELNVSNFLVGNLLPVTVGNVIGGAAMVGLVYWFVYSRHDRGVADGAE